jgi:O-antigen/teichoic acid export membrane protein
VNSLKGKLIKGGFWVGLQRASTMLFNFLKLTLLTHFLTPQQFGIFGVALISLEVLIYFSSIGFNQALIFKKGDVTPYLNSVWTFRILRSILMAVILFALAPAAAAFFDYPEAVNVIRAVSAAYLLGALVTLPIFIYIKTSILKPCFFICWVGM